MSSFYPSPNPRVIETDHLRHRSSQSGISAAAESGQGRGSFAAAGSHHYYPHHPQHPHHNRHRHLRSIGEDCEDPSPSDPKRRRFDFTGGYYPVPSSPDPYGIGYGPLNHRRTSLGDLSAASSPGYNHAPGNMLSGPSSVLSRGVRSPGAGSMGPPPPRLSISSYPPSHHHPVVQQRRQLGSGFDESLRLPPLQTRLGLAEPPPAGRNPSVGTTPHNDVANGSGGNACGSNSNGSNISNGGREGPLHDSQERGVEAMVMSIPYINKLKVLEKISPPLAPPGPSSPAFETRGPVITLEGADSALLERVGVVVERALTAAGECAVQVWTSADEGGARGAGVGTTTAAAAGREGPVGDAGLGLNVEKRRQSSVAGGQSGAADDHRFLFGSYLHTIMSWHAKSAEMVKHITTSPVGGRRINAPLTPLESGREGVALNSHETGTDSTALWQDVTADEKQQRGGKIPVALVAGGFSLSISDRFACRVPITDSYAPVDHWQWMATLWRGIVGPDLVVYVRSATEEELGKLQAVELKTPGIMMVRVHENTGLSEKTERRLGFEIVEWVRAGSFKEGLGG